MKRLFILISFLVYFPSTISADTGNNPFVGKLLSELIGDIDNYSVGVSNPYSSAPESEKVLSNEARIFLKNSIILDSDSDEVRNNAFPHHADVTLIPKDLKKLDTNRFIHLQLATIGKVNYKGKLYYFSYFDEWRRLQRDRK